MPFECHLCALCKAICPEGLDPAAMFLAMREKTFKDVEKKGWHRRILAYEKRGTSRRYTWYALPDGCETVFFPGCTLPGTRPDVTLRLIDYLQHRIPALGIVLDCCTQPSHDLGNYDHFRQMFYEMARYLTRNHVKRILTACPNCHQVFQKYGHGFSVQTVYEFLDLQPPDDFPTLTGSFALHDPCPMRFEDAAMESIRDLAKKTGLSLLPMAHEKARTVCCGEGGAVPLVSKPLSDAWGKTRLDEAGENPVLTYCAGCADTLGRFAPTFHLLDLLFKPSVCLDQKPRASRAPFTYLNRLLLKRKLKKTFPARETRERTFLDGILSFNNLLIADPDGSFALPLAEHLKKMGFSVFTASSGKEALDRLYKNFRVDVVLLNAKFPDMSGTEVLNQIKSFNPFIQVIVLTSQSSVFEAIAAMKSGASEYLEKPLAFEALLNHVQTTMDEKQDYEKQMLAARTGPFITPKNRNTRIAEIKTAAAKKRGDTNEI
jgi:CheY-like chemotaxis protein